MAAGEVRWDGRPQLQKAAEVKLKEADGLLTAEGSETE